MLEILLLGLAGVVVYLVTHFLVTRAEVMVGVPLGHWRSVMFFSSCSSACCWRSCNSCRAYFRAFRAELP